MSNTTINANITHTGKHFKLLLIGDGGVGKSSYVRSLRGSQFEKRYNATMGVEVHPVPLQISDEVVVFDIWDLAGQEKFHGMQEGYYLDAQCAIIMLSDNNQSLKTLNRFKKRLGDIPYVVVFNKSDVAKTTKLFQQHGDPNAFLCSSRTKIGIFEPIVQLTGQL